MEKTNAVKNFITQFEHIIIKIPFISKFLVGKKTEILIARENKHTLWTFAYDRGKYILLPNGEKFMKLGDYNLLSGQLDLLFLVKYPVKNKITGEIKEKFVLERGTIEFDSSALEQIRDADQSKMGDRISERIYYSGLLKYALPHDPYMLLTFAMAAFMCIILFYFLMSNFGGIIDPIHNMALMERPPEIINATMEAIN